MRDLDLDLIENDGKFPKYEDALPKLPEGHYDKGRFGWILNLEQAVKLREDSFRSGALWALALVKAFEENGGDESSEL